MHQRMRQQAADIMQSHGLLVDDWKTDLHQLQQQLYHQRAAAATKHTHTLKTFEQMLMRRVRAYGSSGSQVIGLPALISLQFTLLQPKNRKKSLKTTILRAQGHSRS